MNCRSDESRNPSRCKKAAISQFRKKAENSCNAAIGLVNIISQGSDQKVIFLRRAYQRSKPFCSKDAGAEFPHQLDDNFARRSQMPEATVFEIEREGETIIFTPIVNLR